MWDLRLVDPDNRGPVDFDRRISTLEKIEQKQGTDPQNLLPDLIDRWHTGCIKLFLTQKAIRFRSQHTSLFEEGDFLPLEAAGGRSQNIVSFTRRHNGKQVLIAVPRWLSQLAEPSSQLPEADWKDTILLLPSGSPSNWTSVITSEVFAASDHADKQTLRADSLFRDFPVALLSATS